MKIFTSLFVASLLFAAIFGGEAFSQDYDQGYFRYRVRKGDTLEGILLNIGYPQEALGEMIEAAAVRNGLESPGKILADEYLWIPATIETVEVENETREKEEIVLKILENRMESLELTLEEVRQNSINAKTLEPILKDLGKNEKHLVIILESLQKQEGARSRFVLYWLSASAIAVIGLTVLAFILGQRAKKKWSENFKTYKKQMDSELTRRTSEFCEEFNYRDSRSKEIIKKLLYWIKDYLSKELKEVGRDPSELIQKVNEEVEQFGSFFPKNNQEGGNR